MGDEAWWEEFRALLEEVLDEKLQKVLDKLDKGGLKALNDSPVNEVYHSRAAASSGERFAECYDCPSLRSRDGGGKTTTSLESFADNERLKDYMQVKDVEDHYEGLYEVTRAFNLLCQQDRSTISPMELTEMRFRHHQSHPQAPEESGERQGRFAAVILMANTKIARTEGSRKSVTRASQRNSNRPMDEISLDTFTMIMHRQGELADLPMDQVEDLHEIREILLKEETFRKVAQCTNTNVEEIQAWGPRESMKGVLDRTLLYLDPFIGVIILLNAVIIVISVDYERESEVWHWFELLFGAIFLAELLLRVAAWGITPFLLGEDWAWNIFDTVVVIFSSMALLLVQLDELSVAGDLTLMRLLRFARLTKLVRVLKLKAFAELVMLVNGIIIGFRTLVWVVVFMLFLLVFLGVYLTEALGHNVEEAGSEAFGACAPLPEGLACVEGSRHLRAFSPDLFGNLFRSMFTVFRCLTDGCSSLDGTPLMPYFMDTMGPASIIAYMLVFIFVTFGLFNLIMAVFVESTLAGAKRLETKRKEAQRTEHIRLARELQQLIILFCQGEGDRDNLHRPSISGFLAKKMARFKEMLSTRHLRKSHSEEIKDVHVSQETFCEVCMRPEVQGLLSDLDIDVESRRSLFETIDANSNGTLEVTELVQGLLRLRGCGDRTEAVESLLAIKAMQRSLKAVEVLGLHQQELMQKLVGQQSAVQATVVPQCCSSASLPHTVPGATVAPAIIGQQMDLVPI